MFRYEPPPASPPWCAKARCQAGNFRWIIKNEVTERDWPPTDMKLISGRNPHVESFDDSWATGSILIDPSDAGAVGVYNKMVHRNPDGPDPLVPEP
jgi:hypothetical protein